MLCVCCECETERSRIVGDATRFFLTEIEDGGDDFDIFLRERLLMISVEQYCVQRVEQCDETCDERNCLEHIHFFSC